jgi:hypothetical protein
MHGRSGFRFAGLAGAAGAALLIVALLPASVLAGNAPVITSASGTSLAIGAPGFFTVLASGYPTTPSITESGALPTGVTFVDNGNGTATLGGMPAASSNPSYPLTITATNGTAPDAVQSFTLTVTGAVPNGITSAAATTFTVGSAGYFLVTTNLSPTATNIYETGALPSGVTFVNYGNGTAALTGTPAAATDGSYPITITASNGTLAVSQGFTLTVNPAGAVAFTSAASTTFTPSVYGTFSVTASGSPTPTIALYSGSLPSGMYFAPGTGTGTLYGTPTVTGTYYLGFSATSTAGTVYQSFTLTVGQGATSLMFVTQPGGGAAGAIWTQQPVVEVVNSLNQVVSTDNSTIVYLSIATNPAGGTLSCTGGASEVVVNGYASFSGCSINIGSGSVYTLTATSNPAWTPATSSAFYVTTTSQTSLAISASSALGLKPTSGFTTSTPKYTTVGKYVTWKFNGGSALAGQRVNVLLATRVAGVWGLPKYLKSAWADGTGIVTFARALSSAGAINVRIQWPGSSTYAVSTSKALGAYWK